MVRADPLKVPFTLDRLTPQAQSLTCFYCCFITFSILSWHANDFWESTPWQNLPLQVLLHTHSVHKRLGSLFSSVLLPGYARVREHTSRTALPSLGSLQLSPSVEGARGVHPFRATSDCCAVAGQAQPAGAAHLLHHCASHSQTTLLHTYEWQ